jgi:hypothetical protein
MSRPPELQPDHDFTFQGTTPWLVDNGGGLHGPGERWCRKCGRMLLLVFISSSDWVSHRTEHVSFRDDRTVVREVTVEFCMPEEAPVFRTDDGQFYRLVPLSVMRRKTLVNFKLRDEEGKSVVSLSLRQNQAVTESMLLACADATLEQANGHKSASDCDEIAAFIHEVVSGNQQKLMAAYKSIGKNGDAGDAVRNLVKQHPLFRAILDRLADNFVLWVMIPASAPRRHVLTFSSDEPLSLQYRKPGLQGDKYELGQRLKPLTRTVLFSALGLTTTRIRFPVPAAENSASFHFEIDAPPGVQIAEASLLAGRPKEKKPSFDHVQGGFPTVGLHVIEVPNGSLSRAQIGLQVVNRGWLMTSMLSCWAVFGLLLAIALNQRAVLISGEVFPLVLVALAAGIASLIAQSDTHALAAHLLRWARGLAALAVSLPLVATICIALGGNHKVHRHIVVPADVSYALWTAVVVGGVIAMILTTVCFLSWQRQRKVVRSPWEQNHAPQQEKHKSDAPPPPKTFSKGAEAYDYNKPAMRVNSAEGWHTKFVWDDVAERQLINTLKRQHKADHIQDASHVPSPGPASATHRAMALLRMPRARPDDLKAQNGRPSPHRGPLRTGWR